METLIQIRQHCEMYGEFSKLAKESVKRFAQPNAGECSIVKSENAAKHHILLMCVKLRILRLIWANLLLV